MDAKGLRRAADTERLRALERLSAGRVAVIEAPGGSRDRWLIDLDYRTSGSDVYPAQAQPRSRLAIDCGGRYPFQPPVATILTPIFHPNVFESGVVCLGTRWVASEGLDLFVWRVARLLTYDPMILNLGSVANARAAGWYRAAVRRHPQAFPTDRVAEAVDPPSPAPGQAAAVGAGQRIEWVCPGCGARLRLPAGRQGVVACPRCGREFEART